MSYKVLILRRAQKELSDLPADDYDRVREGIYLPAQTPRPVSCR
jgi:mRNA-degrading endonuclease RelE of RelBE toxin-antitoxin system